MRVNIGELLDGRRAARTVAFSERLESPADDTTLLDAVSGQLSLISTGNTICLAGRLRTTLGLVCGACLRPFEQPLEFEVNEEFGRAALGRGAAADSDAGPSGAAPARAESALGPEDFVIAIGPDESVDLSDVVRQHLVLALPFAPRCRDDCRGLCPACGADLNAGPCACRRETIDSRLEALQRWMPGSPHPRPTKGRESWG